MELERTLDKCIKISIRENRIGHEVNVWAYNENFRSRKSADVVKAVVEMQRNVTVHNSNASLSGDNYACLTLESSSENPRWSFWVGLISIYQHRLFKHFPRHPLEQCWTFEGIRCERILRKPNICIFTYARSILCNVWVDFNSFFSY